MGNIEVAWQAVEEFLALFGRKKTDGRRQYHLFVEQGISQFDYHENL